MVFAPPMLTAMLRRGALAALFVGALAPACGPDTGPKVPGDRYNGVFDSASLDLKFAPGSTSTTTCGSVRAPCYLAQQGWANGKAFKFYNIAGAATANAVRTTPSATVSLFPLATSSLIKVFHFPNNCAKGKEFDPRSDLFREDVQYPLFTNLPFPSTSSSVFVLPLVALHSVSVSGNTCNALKDAASITDGEFGARPSENPTSVQVWAPVDPSSGFQPLGSAATPPPTANAWFRGMQGLYLDGGRVPLDSSGNVVAMDGVILNPVGSAFESVLTNNALILPATPGQDAYSPVVRLRQYRMTGSQRLSDFSGICLAGATCKAKEVPIADTTASFNTIFIVAQ